MKKSIVEIFVNALFHVTKQTAVKLIHSIIDQYIHSVDHIFNLNPYRYKFSHSLWSIDCDEDTTTALSRVLTSHYQTGCTIVYGNSLEAITSWVNTLYPFIIQKKNMCLNIGDIFIPNIPLQGVVTESLDKEDVIYCGYPSTLVNLQNQGKVSVHQTMGYVKYNTMRSSFFEAKTLALLGENNPEDLHLWTTESRNFLRKSKSSRMIRDMVKSFFSLDAHVREMCIRHHHELLIRNSFVMMKIIENEMEEDSFKQANVNRTEFIYNYLMEEMKLYDVEVIKALLGIVERLYPGETECILGDGSDDTPLGLLLF
eukprot:TRINITY_DN4141_c0_g1_i1.p1 TRINITY_DN4141_c0_g1~~TRINITY_DN4141_c0_g1_i1.p1  ORF type:complete len:313 (+),score=58.75 TRINITY_DN4141_c0_g1_i1:403-1341(+)